MNRNKEQMLDFLVKAFIADSDNYKNLDTSGDGEAKRRILRSLMNIRLPRPMPDKVLRIQDEYLRLRAKEKGIVHVSDIPEVKVGIFVRSFSKGEGSEEEKLNRLKSEIESADALIIGAGAG